MVTYFEAKRDCTAMIMDMLKQTPDSVLLSTIEGTALIRYGLGKKTIMKMIDTLQDYGAIVYESNGNEPFVRKPRRLTDTVLPGREAK